MASLSGAAPGLSGQANPATITRPTKMHHAYCQISNFASLARL